MLGRPFRQMAKTQRDGYDSPTMSTTDTEGSSGCEEVHEHEVTSGQKGASAALGTSVSHCTAGSAPLTDQQGRTQYRPWSKEASPLHSL